LRTRLLVGQVLLLTAVCLGIGVATELALHRYLVRQLDTQLVDVQSRARHFVDVGPPPNAPRFVPRTPQPGPPFLDVPGRPVGTIGAEVDGTTVTAAGVLTADATQTALDDAARAQLAALRPDGRIASVGVDGQGAYRVIATRANSGPVIIVGLPLRVVNSTLEQVALTSLAVTIAVLGIAIGAGILIIRRAVAPLDRLSATAARVADLTLDRGEVELPVRVPERDADPGTEVGRLGAALNRMLDHIAGALSARHASESRVRRFLADTSHELRTPLAAIRGYAELADRRRDDVPADVAHAMGRVCSEAERMSRMVEDMLLLARLDAGRPLQREPVDLSVLTIDAVSDAHIAGPDHRWNLDLPGEPVMVTGDAARLYQVLSNLLANARTHTGPGTLVTVSLSAGGPEGGAVWRIVDGGPGIPAELQPEIFERFARGDSSRSRRAGSTGLGLAIVAAVVKAHAGKIVVDSIPGRTEFTVKLPG
jgi:two-component system OmpR family sensor kinase